VLIAPTVLPAGKMGFGHEHDRSLRARAPGERAALLDQLGDPGAVVDRAVVDAIAGGVGRTDPEMVPVTHVDHRLVRIFAAADDAEHIVRCNNLSVRVAVDGERRPERDRPEIPAFGRGLHRFEARA
jgi:hypothetical protein